MLRVPEREVDDVLQDVLMAAYEGLDGFDPARSASAEAARLRVLRRSREGSGGEEQPVSPEEIAARVWLFGIAWRRVFRHLDRAYRRHERPGGLLQGPPFEQRDEAPSAEQLIARGERRALAIRLLDEVAPRRRAVLILKDAFDVPVSEIAETLGINMNTARTWLRLGRAEYRAAVRRLTDEERRALRGAGMLAPLAPAALLRAVVEEPPRGRGEVPEGAWGATRRAPVEAGGLLNVLRRQARHVGTAVLAVCAIGYLHAEPAAWVGGISGIGGATRTGGSAASTAATGAGEPSREQRDAGSGADAEGAEREAGRGTSSAAAVPAAAGERTGTGGRDSLGEERRVLAAARQALARGDAPAALERLADHDRRFPRGQLGDLREELRAHALRAAAREARMLRAGSSSGQSPGLRPGAGGSSGEGEAR